MSSFENATTLTSPIGDFVPPTGKYRGYHVHVTLAGFVVARAQEIIVNVNNNMGPYTELGSRHTKWQPGALEVRGNLRQFTFDTMKLRLAIGNTHTVTGATDGYLTTVSSDSDLSPDLSPAFGTQPWLMPWRFGITIEVHSEASGDFLEFKMEQVMVDTYRLQAVTDGDVVENIAFVAEQIGTRVLKAT
jgi:hypothetical protein